jgi:hypothetical protein
MYRLLKNVAQYFITNCIIDSSSLKNSNIYKSNRNTLSKIVHTETTQGTGLLFHKFTHGISYSGVTMRLETNREFAARFKIPVICSLWNFTDPRQKNRFFAFQTVQKPVLKMLRWDAVMSLRNGTSKWPFVCSLYQMCIWGMGGMTFTGKWERIREKHFPSVTLSTTKPTWTKPGPLQ